MQIHATRPPAPTETPESHSRNVVSRRVGESNRKRLPSPTNTRSVAFSRSSDKLFCDYMDSYLKIKQEASGYPWDCVTEEQKQRYVDAYLEVIGIQLDREKFEHNPGLRALAKLILNSFWGEYYAHMFLSLDLIKLMTKPF